jgi:acyl-CoA thioester hydrolase
MTGLITGQEREAASNEKPFAWPIRVYYEDTDVGGVVYYANYLRFLERARTEWLRSNGFDMSVVAAEHHVHFVVQRAEVDFVQPARLDDALVVTCSLSRASHARLFLEQAVTKDDQLLARAKITLACITTDTWKPAPMPAVLRGHLTDAFEKRVPN